MKGKNVIDFNLKHLLFELHSYMHGITQCAIILRSRAECGLLLQVTFMYLTTAWSEWTEYVQNIIEFKKKFNNKKYKKKLSFVFELNLLFLKTQQAMYDNMEINKSNNSQVT